MKISERQDGKQWENSMTPKLVLQKDQKKKKRHLARLMKKKKKKWRRKRKR